MENSFDTSSAYLNLKGTKENTYDAIVIGSGISGGWAAKELTGKGIVIFLNASALNTNLVLLNSTSSRFPNGLGSCKNVSITDGACMTSTSSQNPSLTYMALTARAVDHAVDELKRGAI